MCRLNETKSPTKKFNITPLLVLLSLSCIILSNGAAVTPILPSIGTRNRVRLIAASTQSVSSVSTSNQQQSLNHETSDQTVPRGGASAASETLTIGSTGALQSIGIIGALSSIQGNIGKRIGNFWRSTSSSAQQCKFLLAGAVAGIVSRTAVSPLEVVATAQMVRGGNAGLVGELCGLFQTEGIRGFFKGNAANCLKVAPTRGIQFFAFEQFKAKLVEWKRQYKGIEEGADVVLTPVERLVAGGFAGMIASSCVYPLEVVKTMLTMYPGKYVGIPAAFRGVIAEAGYKGLYQGLAPTLVAMFPYVGVEFMIYETCKIALETVAQNASGDNNVSLPIIISLGLGAMAGAAAQTSAHPFDVVRKRLQVQGINGNPVLYKNTMDCAMGLMKKEGSGALYKGLGPACVATIPGTGIAYITYEMMKKVLGLNSV